MYPYTIHYKVLSSQKTVSIKAVFCDFEDHEKWEGRIGVDNFPKGIDQKQVAKNILFNVIDTYIQNFKTKQAFVR